MGRVGDQIPFRGFYQVIQHKLDGSLYHRIGDIFQKSNIFRKLVMVVQREGHPRTIQRSNAPHSVHHPCHTEGIGQVVHRPATGMVGLPGRNCPGNRQFAQKSSQRINCFSQVAAFRRPVIHLQVDVGVEVGIPGSLVQIVPDSLQVGRQAARFPGGVHQQVSAILVVERQQTVVGFSLLHPCQPFIR